MNQAPNTTSVDLDQAMALAIEQATEVSQHLVRARAVALNPWYTEKSWGHWERRAGTPEAMTTHPKGSRTHGAFQAG